MPGALPTTPFFQRIMQAGALILPRRTTPEPVRPPEAYQDWPALYQLLLDYYENTGLYEQLSLVLAAQEVPHAAIKGLRNPAQRLTEFYVDHVWPGDLEQALPLTGAGAVKDAVTQIWEWSNWEIIKERYIRSFAIYGDAFLKVAQPVDPQGNPRPRVYLQPIDPRLVT